MSILNPEDYAVDALVEKEWNAFQNALMALENAMGCDAYQTEISHARIAADRLDFAVRDLSDALGKVKGAPEPADA